ncbi:MAG: MBL fold metallo-hydrolase [Bacteroidota bacterium]
MSLKITFLGTGTSSGVPMVGCTCYVCTSTNKKDNRLRSSILVQSETTTLLVDATPDFRQQMLTHKVMRLDAVLITHPHKDHVGGLDDTRAFQFLQKAPTPVYGNALSMAGVKLELPYAFKDFVYPGVPVIDLHEIDLEPFIIGDIPIIPVLVWHFKMPVYGFRFGDFVYITDANRIEEEEKAKIRGCHTLVLNALRYEQHISHFTLPQARAVAEELNVKRAFFTHISHQLGRHTEVNETLPHHIQLAYDGLELHF